MNDLQTGECLTRTYLRYTLTHGVAVALSALRGARGSVAALKGSAGFYWALWQEVQHLLAHLPRPGRRGSTYAIWYDGPRADALRGHHPDFARRLCPTCRTAVLSLLRLPRRYADPRPVCAACYLELAGRSAIPPWRDPDPDADPHPH